MGLTGCIFVGMFVYAMKVIFFKKVLPDSVNAFINKYNLTIGLFDMAILSIAKDMLGHSTISMFINIGFVCGSFLYIMGMIQYKSYKRNRYADV